MNGLRGDQKIRFKLNSSVSGKKALSSGFISWLFSERGRHREVLSKGGLGKWGGEIGWCKENRGVWRMDKNLDFDRIIKKSIRIRFGPPWTCSFSPGIWRGLRAHPAWSWSWSRTCSHTRPRGLWREGASTEPRLWSIPTALARTSCSLAHHLISVPNWCPPSPPKPWAFWAASRAWHRDPPCPDATSRRP